jgi:hypothetical protein
MTHEVPETPNPRYRGFGKTTTLKRGNVTERGDRSISSIEPAIALVDHDCMTPLVAPTGSVIVPAVDIVEDQGSISMTLPLLPVAVPESLDSHHSWGMALHNHSAHRTAVAGISIVYRYPPGNRAAANHDFCRNALSLKRSCDQRQTCDQRPCTSAGLHIGLDWWTGEPQQAGNARVVPPPK